MRMAQGVNAHLLASVTGNDMRAQIPPHLVLRLCFRVPEPPLFVDDQIAQRLYPTVRVTAAVG